MKTIYFDNNATTKVAEEVLEEMKPYFCELYGNPSSMHTFGGQVGVNIRQAREQVAGLLGCEPSEIIFTGCGTESDNTAINGVLSAVPNRRKVITSRIEHPAVLTVCRELENHGYTVVELGVDKQGQLDLKELEDQLDDDTALVTIMYANNETGVVFPIEEIAEMASDRDIVFHTDQEAGRRAGTENVAGIIGLGKACELAANNFDEENNRIKSLRDKLENTIVQSCPDCFVNGDKENRLPNTANISFEYIEGEAILLMLDKYGICASSGSACTSGSLEPSHVLRAMGVPFTAAHGSIRFSLSRYNTEKEVDFVIEKMPEIVNKLRELSPFVEKE
ncbi:MAG: aminotransferase class V-fold PLP-dependent enzyme [Planctomycetota bacterium]|jgi:cysteine desulfurase